VVSSACQLGTYILKVVGVLGVEAGRDLLDLLHGVCVCLRVSVCVCVCLCVVFVRVCMVIVVELFVGVARRCAFLLLSFPFILEALEAFFFFFGQRSRGVLIGRVLGRLLRFSRGSQPKPFFFSSNFLRVSSLPEAARSCKNAQEGAGRCLCGWCVACTRR
jgi:hypothetical protein